MSEDLEGVGKVKQDQATDDRIKSLSIPKCPHVCLKERDVVQAGSEASMLGNLQQPRALIDAHDYALLPNKVRYLKGDMAKPGPEIEHPHPRRDPSPAFSKTLTR